MSERSCVIKWSRDRGPGTERVRTPGVSQGEEDLVRGQSVTYSLEAEAVTMRLECGACFTKPSNGLHEHMLCYHGIIISDWETPQIPSPLHLTPLWRRRQWVIWVDKITKSPPRESAADGCQYCWFWWISGCWGWASGTQAVWKMASPRCCSGAALADDLASFHALPLPLYHAGSVCP